MFTLQLFYILNIYLIFLWDGVGEYLFQIIINKLFVVRIEFTFWLVVVLKYRGYNHAWQTNLNKDQLY